MNKLLLKSLILQLFLCNFAWAANLVDISAKPWPTSAVDKFASRVCGDTLSDVQDHMKANGFPFFPNLVRKIDHSHCHIVFQPSVKGFRAKPDFGAVKSLLFNVSGFPVELGRKRVWGDSFDIWRSVRKVRSDVPQIVFVDQPSTRQDFVKIDSEIIGWPQDYIVSGETSNEEQFLLVAHQIFEGDFDRGERFVPFLNELQTKISVKNRRSKLSWEGGDFVILAIPGTNKTLLVYGDTVSNYWAAELNVAELEYVLKNEFGVDAVLDGRHLSSHVDYTVIPLDGQRVLVRKPFTNNTQFICDLTSVMMRDFTMNLKVTPTKLSLLQSAACNPKKNTDLKVLAENSKLEFMDRRQDWVQNRSMNDVQAEFLDVLSKKCNMSDSSCLEKLMTTLNGLLSVQAISPKVVEAYLNSMVDGVSNNMRFQAYFDLLQGQFLTVDQASLQRLETLQIKLEALGFKVLSVPSPHHESAWAGVSYVNSLVIDKDLFIPSFGLGVSESRIRDEISRQAPDIKVHLVPALLQLSKNGGVHCSVKAIR